ncbi:uncharacterized protein B0H18DRAFT_671931 [Fomitopsis serialis]|uniref:uncharacterized protein n=1 Tax=Fomitopsis serialis TaxID=139415 RepID=UPI0020072D36|nr:uncharacterized protein B0H18DRAFT_671931 [Neoantrodia serialis]KAH9932928.1 hypothetical protein B0H18DRAFT_671931 [Neoantrodia serialis]
MLFISLFAVVACAFAGSSQIFAAPIPIPNGGCTVVQRQFDPWSTGNIQFGSGGMTPGDVHDRSNDLTADELHFGVAGDGLVVSPPSQDVIVPKSS